MKAKWLAAAVFAGSLAASCNAQVSVGVTIGAPPPPLRYEVPPPIPGPEFLWIDGYWNVARSRYVWVPGRWERRPYDRAYYVRPHYDHYRGGWRVRRGHWDHEGRDEDGDHHGHHGRHHDD